MKNKLKHTVSMTLLWASVLTFSSCSDWTDPESLYLHTPSFEEQHPQLYADYIKDLKDYKAGEHKMTFVSFENPLETPVKQGERLTVVPDSVDFICLNNPDQLHPVVQEEMIKIRGKGTRTIYNIDYASFETTWKEMSKANPELTEENALQYLGERTDAMLALCDKYNYDGVIVEYAGRSLVSLPEMALAEYNARQQNFFNRVMAWQSNHTDKTLVFYGNVQYLVPENMGMLSKYNYIMLKTAASTNADALALQAYLAIQAGEGAVGEEEGAVNPVPSDRFLACVMLPQADDKDQVKGYWNTVDASGNKTLAAQGAAQWITQQSSDYTREGIFIMNVHNDYYNNTYGYVREVIRIMNPNK